MSTGSARRDKKAISQVDAKFAEQEAGRASGINGLDEAFL